MTVTSVTSPTGQISVTTTTGPNVTLGIAKIPGTATFGTAAASRTALGLGSAATKASTFFVETSSLGAHTGVAELDGTSHLKQTQSQEITGDATKPAGSSAITVKRMTGNALGAPNGPAQLNSSGHLKTTQQPHLVGGVTKNAASATATVAKVPSAAVSSSTGITTATTTGGKLTIKQKINSGTLTDVSNIYTPTISAPRSVWHIPAPTANFTVANPTGTPQDGAALILEIACAAAPWTITWTTKFTSSGVATLPALLPVYFPTIPHTKTITCGFMWNATRTKWVLLSLDAVGY